MPPLKILGLGSFGFRRSGTRVRSCGVAILDKRDRTHLQTEREPRMTSYRAKLTVASVAIICFVGSAPSAAWAQAGAISKDMQNNCVNDYKKFCGDYGLQSAALNLCMKKAGPGLSPACVQALVQAGKVSQAEVDRIKAQMKGR
jgi:hypothetical protein